MVRKAITPIIATALLILMTVVSVGASFFWITGVGSSLEEQTGGVIESAGNSGCSRLTIISMRGDNVVVQNTGCDIINNVTLLIDGVLTSYGLSAPLAPGDTSIITFNSLSTGKDHCIKLSLGSSSVSSCSLAVRNTVDGGYSFNETENGGWYDGCAMSSTVVDLSNTLLFSPSHDLTCNCSSIIMDNNILNLSYEGSLTPSHQANLNGFDLWTFEITNITPCTSSACVRSNVLSPIFDISQTVSGAPSSFSVDYYLSTGTPENYASSYVWFSFDGTYNLYYYIDNRGDTGVDCDSNDGNSSYYTFCKVSVYDAWSTLNIDIASDFSNTFHLDVGDISNTDIIISSSSDYSHFVAAFDNVTATGVTVLNPGFEEYNTDWGYNDIPIFGMDAPIRPEPYAHFVYPGIDGSTPELLYSEGYNGILPSVSVDYYLNPGIFGSYAASYLGLYITMNDSTPLSLMYYFDIQGDDSFCDSGTEDSYWNICINPATYNSWTTLTIDSILEDFAAYFPSYSAENVVNTQIDLYSEADGAGYSISYDDLKIRIETSIDNFFCDSGNDGTPDGVCSLGFCSIVNLVDDENQQVCEFNSHTWFSGSVNGTNGACCGDDGLSDNFFINPLNTSNNFCVDGNAYFTSLDINNSLCSFYNYTWINPSYSAYLLGYWNLDENSGSTINDLSGNNNIGTIYGGTSWADGKFGKALDFDSSRYSDYVSISHDGSLNFNQLTENYSISLWFKTDFIPAPGDDPKTLILDRPTLEHATSYAIDLRTGNEILFSTWNTVTGDGVSFAGINTGEWYHVIAVSNTTHMMLYINGELKGITAITVGSCCENNDGIVEIGRSGDWRGCCSEHWFDGIIDDVRIYNKALTLLDARSIYLDTNSEHESCCGDDGTFDNFNNITLACEDGVVSALTDDNSHALCELDNYTWFSGSVNGTNGACCGDDGLSDNFLINPFNNSSHFCINGLAFNQSIDDSPYLCNYYGYTWFSNTTIMKFYSFDGYVGTDAADWYEHDPEHAHVISSFEGRDTVYEIQDVYSRGPGIYTTFTAPLIAGNVSFWVMPHYNPSGTQNVWTNIFLINSSNTTVINVRFLDGWESQSLDIQSNGINVMKFVKNTWYKVLVELDSITGKYNLYINDILVLIQHNFTAPNGIIRFWTQGGWNEQDKYYIDDVSFNDIGNTCCGDDGILDTFNNSTNYCCSGVFQETSCS
ncbi:Concanavalin A-like lectin/glucanases superfamily protein [Candidatus Tiddalikarchaeum anstoanum]|nr:Concanavalin A-like lectin/glucanases superfamily protein [Candidatus Tiddalikarchaeum anstoanum]